ncbi:hypothetical protein [Trichloromonas sp.]|uniref:hypothetical protein n=1 Tax=Trichloromonas sp. TaxID=3069249 RepID=UPI003D818AF9
MKKRVGVALLAGLLALWVPLAQGRPVSDSLNPHNLSFGATHGRTKADVGSEFGSKEICIFCHTPHSSSAQGPLWNRLDPANMGSFPLYNSASLKIKDIPQAQYNTTDYPNGASKLCLSCHDGVTGIGTLLDRAITMNNASMPLGFEIDLTQTHPVSFVYDNAVLTAIQGAGKPGYTLPSLSIELRDSQSRIQCTTCHDPHDDRDEYAGDGVPPFWRYISATAADSYNDVCNTCHPGSELTTWSIGSGDNHTGTFPR